MKLELLMRLEVVYAQSKNGVIGNKGEMPWPTNKEDLLKLKNKVKPKDNEEGFLCLMGKDTYYSMNHYFPKAKKKGYPYARKTIVLSSSMEDEEGIERFRSVDEFLNKYQYSDELIIVLGGAKTIESLSDHIDKIYRTTFPDDYEGDAHAPKLPPCYVGDDIDYLDNRPEEFKGSKLKHEILTPIRDSTSRAIVEAYGQSYQR